LKLIPRAVSWRVETAPPVIAKIHKPGKGGKATAIQADALRGLFPLERGSVSRSTSGDSKPLRVTDPRSEVIVEYEPDPNLRDTEKIPFLEAPPSGNPGGLPSEASAKEGIEAFIRREVLPYTH